MKQLSNLALNNMKTTITSNLERQPLSQIQIVTFL